MESFESAESSTVTRGEYDFDTETLMVTFKHGGVYQFQIPPELWQEFATAESKGKFFAAAIRPLYNGVRV